MPLDSFGIWQYTESETAAPVSTMLNRLAGSVSDAAGPYIIDTGWVDCALSANTTADTGHMARARRVGKWVRVEGRLRRDSGTGSAQLYCIIPPTAGGYNLRAPRTYEIGDKNVTNATARAYVDENGGIRATGNGTGAQYIFFSCSYMVD